MLRRLDLSLESAMSLLRILRRGPLRGIRCNGGDVVHRCETVRVVDGEQDGVVLRMGVGCNDEVVERRHLEKPSCVLLRRGAGGRDEL